MLLPPWVFVFLLLSVLTFALLWAAKSLLFPRRVRSYKEASQIRNLLSPPHTPLEDLLVARATPNQRLVDAFGITNTFVSSDAKVHKTFTTRAKALITNAGDKGHPLRAVVLGADATVQQFLPVQHSVADFATLIQCITFAVILSALFDTDLDMLRYDDVVHVTNVINKRWKDSKVKDTTAMRQDDSLRSLITHLDHWIIDHDRYPNPLDFILPAYETMWRVVAVTVAYIYRGRDGTVHDAVVAFGKDPTEERFLAFGEDGLHPSMQSIVLEVLRLHPPTRHIVRASAPTTRIRGWLPGFRSLWRTFVTSRPAVEIADVEGVHLSEEYGENTAEFDPMRFHPSRMCERPDLFSFGYGRLKCVAAAWAPMAAAVIAAAVISQIEEARCKVTVGPRIGGRSGWEGWTIAGSSQDE